MDCMVMSLCGCRVDKNCMVTLMSLCGCRVDKNCMVTLMSLCGCRVDKKRDKLERKVLDSQERAFWDVHRPAVSTYRCLYTCTLCHVTQVAWWHGYGIERAA